MHRTGRPLTHCEWRDRLDLVVESAKVTPASAPPAAPENAKALRSLNHAFSKQEPSLVEFEPATAGEPILWCIVHQESNAYRLSRIRQDWPDGSHDQTPGIRGPVVALPLKTCRRSELLAARMRDAFRAFDAPCQAGTHFAVLRGAHGDGGHRRSEGLPN